MKPILAICVLLLSACAATPEGKRAKADAAVIGKHTDAADVAAAKAKTENDRIAADSANLSANNKKAQADNAAILDDAERIEHKAMILRASEQTP